jgi:hypothetical protein
MIWGFSKGALLGLCPYSSLEADGVESLCMQLGGPHCEAAGDGDHRKHTRCLPKRLVKGDGCKNLLVESRSRCCTFSERIGTQTLPCDPPPDVRTSHLLTGFIRM